MFIKSFSIVALLLFSSWPSSAQAKGRFAPIVEEDLREATSYCNSLGCFTIKAGKVKLYDLEPKQLAEGILEEPSNLQQELTLPRSMKVSFNVEGDGGFIKKNQCSGILLNELGWGSSFSFAGLQFTIKDLCLMQASSLAPLMDNAVWEMEGLLNQSQPIEGVTYNSIDPVRVVAQGSLPIAKAKAAVISGKVQEDVRLKIGSTIVDIFAGDLIFQSFEVASIQSRYGRIRNLPYGFTGTSASFNRVTGALLDFTPPKNTMINDVVLEPNSSVEVYPNGEVKTLVYKRYVIQLIQGFEVGSISGFVGTETAYFWPNGKLQFVRTDGGLNGVVQTDRNEHQYGTSATLAFSPMGRLVLRSIVHVNGTGDAVQVSDNITGDWRILTKSEIDPLHLNYFPSKELITFLETYQ